MNNQNQEIKHSQSEIYSESIQKYKFNKYLQKIDSMKILTILKNKINEQFIKYESLRYYVNLLILIIFLIVVFQAESVIKRTSFDENLLSRKFQKKLDILDQKKIILTVKDLQEHFYNTLQNSSQIDELLFSIIGLDNFKTTLTTYHSDILNKNDYQLNLFQEFTIENVKEVLKLPFDPNNGEDTKKFLIQFPTIKITCENIEVCNKNFCYRFSYDIRYFYQQTSYIVILQMYFDYEQDENGKNNNHLNKKLFPLFILLILSILSLILFTMKYRLQIKEKSIYKYFWINIIYHRYTNDFKELDDEKNHSLKFWDFLSLSRDIIYIGYFLALISQYESRKTYIITLKNLSFVISVLLFIPIMQCHRKLKLIFDVLIITLRNSIQIFISMTAITIAFIFVGHLLFKESENFNGLIKTTTSIFSLMSGDSILDMLIDIKERKLLGFAYIFFVVVFFVFFFQSLYVTLVTDSYFLVVQEFAKIDNLQEEQKKEEEQEEEMYFQFIEKWKNKIKIKQKQMFKREKEQFYSLKEIIKKNKKNKSKDIFFIKKLLKFLIENVQKEKSEIQKFKK